MSASWKPDMRPRSFYPQPLSNHRPNVESKGSNIKVSKQIPTRRVWHSRKAENQCERQSTAESATFSRVSHSREELLYLRQLLIEHKDLCCAPACAGWKLKDLSKESEKALPSEEIAKKRSTDSVCSTADTQSNASEEFDGATSCTELNSVEGSLESLSALRASAPEFIPHDVSNAILESSPLEAFLPSFLSEDIGCVGQKFADPCIVEAIDATNEALEVVDITDESDNARMNTHAYGNYSDAATMWCYEEWRQYCGLSQELPELLAHSFNDPWAHRSSLAEVLATSPPGQLFAVSR